MEKIFSFHQDVDICYTLDDEAEKLFERITDKYSGQFNLKYSSGSQLPSSQPELDVEEKAEICVRTKATELIGRLTCILWVYCNGRSLPALSIEVTFIITCMNCTFQHSSVFCTTETSAFRRKYRLSMSPKQNVLSVAAMTTQRLFHL